MTFETDTMDDMDMMMVDTAPLPMQGPDGDNSVEDDLLSDSCYQEALQVLELWNEEESEESGDGGDFMAMFSPTTSAVAAASDDSTTSSSSLDLYQDSIMMLPSNDNGDVDDDLIMQLEDDEGLLPEFDEVPDLLPMESLLGDAVLQDLPSADLFLKDEDPASPLYSSSSSSSHRKNSRTILLEQTLQKLKESMKKSRETRKSLVAKTPKLKDYDRTGSVHTVLKSIEFSSQQIRTRLA